MPNYWVLKNAPGNVDWKEWLWPGNEVREGTEKPVKKLKPKDRIFYWKSTPATSLVALGEVVTVRHATTRGRRTHVTVRVRTPELDPPLHLHDLRRVRELGSPGFLKSGAAGTFFSLDTDAAELLYQLCHHAAPAWGSVWREFKPVSSLSRKVWARVFGRGGRQAEQLKPAKNDEETRQLAARRIRGGAKDFRSGLRKLYRDRCVISGTGPATALDACHLAPHAGTGNNAFDNGLLLRSDIHNLFDAGLMAIHPSTKRVYCHPALKGTAYWRFRNQPIRKPDNGPGPNSAYLKARWDALAR